MTTTIMRKHDDIRMGVWVDRVLIPSIVIRGEIDTENFVGKDRTLQEENLRAIFSCDSKAIEKKSIEEMINQLMIKTLYEIVS